MLGTCLHFFHFKFKSSKCVSRVRLSTNHSEAASNKVHLMLWTPHDSLSGNNSNKTTSQQDNKTLTSPSCWLLLFFPKVKVKRFKIPKVVGTWKKEGKETSSKECVMLPRGSMSCETRRSVCVCVCVCVCVNRQRGTRAPFWGVSGANFRPQMGPAELPFLESPGSRGYN